MNLETQFDTAIVMLGMGIGFGILLDIYRRIRPKRGAGVFFTDALFWSGYALLLFTALYRVNDGFVRGAFFFFLLLGIALYLVILRYVFLPLIDALFFFIRTVYNITAAIIRIFLVSPFLFIVKCMVSLAKTSYSLLSWLVKVLVLRPWAAMGRLKK